MTVNFKWAVKLVAVTACCLLASCKSTDFEDKHTSEEMGYLSLFKNALAGSCRVGKQESVVVAVAPMQTQCGVGPMMEPVFCMTPMPVYGVKEIKGLNDITINSEAVRNDLTRLAPPKSLRPAHMKLFSATEAERVAASSENTVKSYKAACSAYNSFEAEVNTRIQTLKTNASIYLTFQPNIGPSVTLDSRKGFEVDTSFTVPLAWGSLTPGYKTSQGVHRLRVIYNKKERVFLLDRPFEFYIPSGYATTVSYPGKDELIIRVVKH